MNSAWFLSVGFAHQIMVALDWMQRPDVRLREVKVAYRSHFLKLDNGSIA